MVIGVMGRQWTLGTAQCHSRYRRKTEWKIDGQTWSIVTMTGTLWRLIWDRSDDQIVFDIFRYIQRDMFRS